jgi:hypothetical protein
LQAKLPYYMVPSYIVIIESMPLTPNGKINHAALPQPQPAKEEGGDSSEVITPSMRPLTDVEHKLVALWSALLKARVRSVDDNFFDLGGHSLLATRLVMEIGRILRIDVPFSVIFQAPTVAAMARKLEEILSESADAHADTSHSVLDATLQADALPALPPTLPLARPGDVATASAVLLTGGTGFLGAFILHELLTCSSATIYCQVRAGSREEAGARVKASLQAVNRWEAAYAARLVGVPGDLSKPWLGMSAEDWDMLAGTADLIIHNGAYVHWLLPYSASLRGLVVGRCSARRENRARGGVG